MAGDRPTPWPAMQLAADNSGYEVMKVCPVDFELEEENKVCVCVCVLGCVSVCVVGRAGLCAGEGTRWGEWGRCV